MAKLRDQDHAGLFRQHRTVWSSENMTVSGAFGSMNGGDLRDATVRRVILVNETFIKLVAP
jgi:hypothetical protein